MSTASDLGRRVRERRHSLGLTCEDLALRAEMSRNFVGYLETSSAPELSHEALWRLGAALECNVEALTGGGMEDPPGGAVPSGRAMVEAMDASECLAIIGGGGIGRIVFCEERGPVALPVNFRVLSEQVVFLVGYSSSLVNYHGSTEISFEVDRIDEALTEGWSVLITGPYRVVIDAAEVDEARLQGVVPWTGGVHEALVTITPRMVTGRRIRRSAGATHSQDAVEND
jgi:nitroimidazol reductase NimA-like FMN-containing flavoprotein (pyridoxamine 5'-phosphate oxidase superfamily)